MKWFITRFNGSETGKLKLLPGDLLLHFRTPLLGSGKPEVLDLWQMNQEGYLWLTNKQSDMPPGFELQLDEVCNAAASRMMDKVKQGWSLGEKAEAPNIWRVRTGDRLALLGERAWQEGGVLHGIFEFDTSALAYWLREDGDMPLMEEAMAGAPAEEDAMRLEWARCALSKVTTMGVPRVMATDWRIE